MDLEVKSWCNFQRLFRSIKTEEERLKGHAQWPIFMNRSNRCSSKVAGRPWKNISAANLENPIHNLHRSFFFTHTFWRILTPIFSPYQSAGTHFVLADLHWLILFCLFCSETLFASAYHVPDKFVLWHILYWNSFCISLLCTGQFCTMANFVLRPTLN